YLLSDRAVDAQHLTGVDEKGSTSLARDCGRITIRQDLWLYLFGTPGQDRFWFMWDELALGALGAVVLADTRRLADCFPAVDYFEQLKLPFVVAVNCFDGARRHEPGKVRKAVGLDDKTPIIMCDARDRASVKEVLTTLVTHAM